MLLENIIKELEASKSLTIQTTAEDFEKYLMDTPEIFNTVEAKIETDKDNNIISKTYTKKVNVGGGYGKALLQWNIAKIKKNEVISTTRKLIILKHPDKPHPLPSDYTLRYGDVVNGEIYDPNLINKAGVVPEGDEEAWMEE